MKLHLHLLAFLTVTTATAAPTGKISVSIAGEIVSEFIAAMPVWKEHGWFDYRRKGEPLAGGYESPPMNWGLSSERKRGFFKLLAEINGSQKTGVMRGNIPTSFLNQ